MTHLLLVRHGQTDWNSQGRFMGHSDISLNEIGRRQAADLAQRLAGQAIDLIFTSDLQRALETAAIIGRRVGAEIQADSRLREMHFGLIEGLTFDQAQARYPETVAGWLEDRDKPPQGGEPYAAFSRRVASFLEMLPAAYPDETILVVSHGGPIREMLRLALGLPPEGHWYFKIDQATLSEIGLYEERPVLVRLNDGAHLQEST